MSKQKEVKRGERLVYRHNGSDSSRGDQSSQIGRRRVVGRPRSCHYSLFSANLGATAPGAAHSLVRRACRKAAATP